VSPPSCGIVRRAPGSPDSLATDGPGGTRGTCSTPVSPFVPHRQTVLRSSSRLRNPARPVPGLRIGHNPSPLPNAYPACISDGGEHDRSGGTRARLAPIADVSRQNRSHRDSLCRLCSFFRLLSRSCPSGKIGHSGSLPGVATTLTDTVVDHGRLGHHRRAIARPTRRLYTSWGLAEAMSMRCHVSPKAFGLEDIPHRRARDGSAFQRTACRPPRRVAVPSDQGPPRRLVPVNPSLVSERVDRIQSAGAPGRIETKEYAHRCRYADRHGHHGV